MNDKIKSILTCGLIILLLFLFSLYIVNTILDSLNTTIIECEESIDVKYRVVPMGGIFGGTQKIETKGEIYDGYMEKCIRGKNWKGDLIKR